MNLYELSEGQRNNYNDLIKQHRKELSDLEIVFEVENKLSDIIKKYGIKSGDYYHSCWLEYSLKKDEDLNFVAWQIFEDIDEVIKTDAVTVNDESIDEGTYYIIGWYKTIQVRLDINFSKAEKCKLEYVDKLKKEAVLRCA